MKTFSFDYNNLFLRYSNKHNNIQIYQLQNFDSFPLTSRDWKFVASIGPNEKYDCLKIFGTEIADVRLRNLQEDLCVSHLMINPEGFCYLDATEIAGPTFNVQYYRLNDLFCWSEYVDVPSEIKFNTSWNRYGIQTSETMVDYEELNKKSRLLKQVEDELESTRKQLAAAKTELKSTEKELKLKINELSDANDRIFRYEARLDSKDKKLEKLRERVSKLEQFQIHNEEEENVEEMKRATPNEAGSSSTSTSLPQMRQEMLTEWQRFTDVWIQNKEKIHKFILNFSIVSVQLLHRPQFEGTLREFMPVDDFTFPDEYVSFNTKPGQFDKENWWCIGSHEHNKRIDLSVYDGTFGSVQAYDTTVHIPYRQKFFFSNVQCFVGFLRGVGFRFMYVSKIHE